MRSVEADIAAIKEKINQYAIACNNGDFDRWLSLWTDSGVQLPPDTTMRIGKEQIKEGMKPVFDNFISQISIVNKEAKVSGDLGYLCGTYTSSSTPKAGGKRIEVDDRYLTVLERQADGSWKITHDSFNFNVPPG